MFQIAICDDEILICAHIEEILKKAIADIKTEIFYTGESLYAKLKNDEEFDLIFLDVELDALDGVEVGRLIREELKNEYTQIVYISGKEGYAMSLFQNRPLNFLVKPLSERKIIEAALKAIELTEKSQAFFEFRFAKKEYKIPVRDILFFESVEKKVSIHTMYDTYSFTGKISDVLEKLGDNLFIQIHKSIMVNYSAVKEYKYDRVTLVDNSIHSISQINRKKVKEKILAEKMKYI